MLPPTGQCLRQLRTGELSRYVASHHIATVPVLTRALAHRASPVSAVVEARTPHVTVESVAAVAALGIIGTGFAYVLNYQIITSEGATSHRR